MNIIQKTSIHNTSSKPNRNIEFIVLHYTAGTYSSSNAALNTANYFAHTTNNASADFIVDDSMIVQYNPDVSNRYTWAVGGKKYYSMSTSLGGQFYNICRNDNSISIEMSSCKINKASLNAADTDWYFTTDTINNAVDLTKYLMNKYKVNIDHVIMHHQVNGKVCPQPWCLNESRLQDWYKFKSRLQGEDEMTQEQFNEMFKIAMNSYRNSLQDNDAGAWSENSRKWAVDTGLIKGSNQLPDGTPNYMWQDFLTREQMVEILNRFSNMK